MSAALALAAVSASAAAAPVPALSAGCVAPPQLMAIGPALDHTAARIERGKRLTIVAMGSSSTAGVGASSPSMSYPSRLQAALAERYPEDAIRVINRGKGGEDAPEEMARLNRDVIAEHPDLVIWQVGTNAVLRRDDLAGDGERIERGVGLLKQDGSDVVLMDMQYAPLVIARPAYAAMERLIANLAKGSRVGRFRRFDIMRYWQEAGRGDAPPMVGPDGLHMTDRGYGCLAIDLADALAANWRAHERMVQRQDGATVAGRAEPGRDVVPAGDAAH